MKERHAFKGQSLVEFALVFPLFFFLITGLFDLGRAVFAETTLNNAVREGTRFAIVQAKPVNTSLPTSTFTDPVCQPNSGNPQIVIAVENKVCNKFINLKDFVSNSTIRISYLNTTSENPKIQIQIVYQFNPITPGIKLIVGQGKSLLIKAQSEMFLAAVAK